MSEDLRYLLRSLAEADASAEAPPEVEVRLRKKFRSLTLRRVWRRTAVWGPIAAAIIGLIFASASRKPPAAPVKEAAHDALSPVVSKIEMPSPISPTAPTPVRRPASANPTTRQAEIVTEFFPLMDPAPPIGRGQLLRVELPAAAMQMVGLPVHEEHLSDVVHADVLLGEEGLPRAIRFVKFEIK